MRKSKKFVFFWFSPAKRKIVRPEVHVEIGGGMTRVLKMRAGRWTLNYLAGQLSSGIGELSPV